MNTDFNNSKCILLRKDSLERHCGGCVYTCLFIGIPCSIALCRYCCFLFNKLKVSGNPVLNVSFDTILPTALFLNEVMYIGFFLDIMLLYT